jgi:hypothetical protein
MKTERIQKNHCCHEPAFMQKGTVKWGNTVIGINIVTSLSKFLTGHFSRTNEFNSLAKKAN